MAKLKSITAKDIELLIKQIDRALKYAERDENDDCNPYKGWQIVGYQTQTLENLKKQLSGEHPIM